MGVIPEGSALVRGDREILDESSAGRDGSLVPSIESGGVSRRLTGVLVVLLLICKPCQWMEISSSSKALVTLTTRVSHERASMVGPGKSPSTLV